MNQELKTFDFKFISHKIIEEIYKTIITSPDFKKNIMELVSLNCNKENKIFFKYILNILIAPDPNYRLSMRELNKLINIYFESPDYVKLKKNPILIYNWIEEIFISNENNIKSISIISNILNKHNFTKFQRRFIINKTIKLINLYSNLFNYEKFDKIFIISCLQLILYVTYTCVIKIKNDDEMNENIKKEIKNIINKLYCTSDAKQPIIFPIPTFYE